jgi:hypothetical protein
MSDIPTFTFDLSPFPFFMVEDRYPGGRKPDLRVLLSPSKGHNEPLAPGTGDTRPSA